MSIPPHSSTYSLGKEEWTDEEWEIFIQTKISDVLSPESLGAGSPAPLATISTPADPRFPLAIDHTLLKQDATPEDIDSLCNEANKYGFKSCCINGIYVKQVVKKLKAAGNSQTIACCVVGFPLGAGSAEAKAFEAKQAIQDGALEIDTIIPLGLLLSKPPRFTDIFKHLQSIIQASAPIPVKVILETGLIPTPELKITACILASEAGAAFVKTCTGFAAGGGATTEDVALMYSAVRYHGNVKVKASGGVRTFEACLAMFSAGAERIGTSSGANLMQGVPAVPSGY